MMDDHISRQAAIDAFDGVKVDEENCTEYDIGYNDGIDFAVSRLSVLPSAEPNEEFEWCHDCKEYDQDAHCCHRWTRVIKKTVAELEKTWPKQQWVSCSERLPEVGKSVLCQCRAGIFMVLKRTEARNWMQDDTHFYLYAFVIAWMPLPEPYKETVKRGGAAWPSSTQD